MAADRAVAARAAVAALETGVASVEAALLSPLWAIVTLREMSRRFAWDDARSAQPTSAEYVVAADFPASR